MLDMESVRIAEDVAPIVGYKNVPRACIQRKDPPLPPRVSKVTFQLPVEPPQPPTPPLLFINPPAVVRIPRDDSDSESESDSEMPSDAYFQPS
ncbi:hypothetical protein DIPPA_08091 [Diplonema papillatum]|nr:hypothetical protein DIPPA_08091 [Diplonema papillatum]